MLIERRACCKWLWLLLWQLTVVGGVWLSPAIAGTSQPEVLILNSYHSGFSWSDEEQAGVLARLRESYPNISLYIEYLDEKRFPGKDHLSLMKAHLIAKYVGKGIDLLIVLDNPALDLALQFRKELFPEVPIVFAGINDFKPEMLDGHDKVTGVSEITECAGTIEVALALHPKTREILVVHDFTATGQIVHSQFQKMLPAFDGRVKVSFMQEFTFDELVERVGSLSPDTIILVMALTTDSTGMSLPASDAVRLVASSAKVPVYAMHEIRLGYGIVGGVLLGGELHGRRAGNIAVRVLAGEDPSSIPVDMKSTAVPMFDYQQLSRFHIPLAALPEGSKVINLPESVYFKHPSLVLGTLVVVLVLTISVIVLGLHIIRRREVEEALRKSEEKYRILVENANSIILRLDRKGRITFFNKYAEKFFGYSQDQILSRHAVGTIVPEMETTGRDLEAMIADLVDHPEQYALNENENMRRSDERVWVAWANKAIPNAAGGFDEILCVGNDITEGKRAEQARRESEERYQTLFRNDHIVMLVVDPDTTAIVDANPAAVSFYGYGRYDLLKLKISDINTSALEDVNGAIQKVLTRQQNRFEFRHRLANGEIRDVEVHSGPINIGGRKLLYSIILDETEHKRAEEALRESEERFATVFRASPICTSITRLSDGKVLDVNDAFLRLFGYGREEVIGRDPLTLDMWVNPEDHARMLHSLLENGKAEGFETIFRTKYGGIRNVVVVAELFDTAGERYILGLLLDVTERKRTAEEKERLESQLRQAQKMEAIGTLAGGIAHDFNNILAAILGYTEMSLEDIPKYAPARHDLEQVLKATHRAKDLVRQVLTFSRQKDTQERRPIEIAPVIKEALKLLRATLPTTIEIRHGIPDASGAILGDPSQIHQVVMNLCTNAAHAMRVHGGELEVAIASVEGHGDMAGLNCHLKPGPYVRLTVRDTGHGMDAETVERIFDPYFTTKRVGEGSGLGLAVVHGIVKRHEGTISVKSEPGNGTVFNVVFPKIELMQESEIDGPDQAPGGAERILFVDDEMVLTSLAERMLNGLGYQVTVRTSGIEAIELFRGQPDAFDLVITDYTMPRMTGMELASEILLIRPDTPIVLCTGYSEMVNEDEARKIGIREYAFKPLSRRDIALVIRRVLEN